MKLVWLDLETTGLNPKEDVILEIGIILNPGESNEQRRSWVLDYDIVFIMHLMDSVVLKMHTDSGLLAEVEASDLDINDVENDVVSMFTDNGITHNNVGKIAGYGPHFDLKFLDERIPCITDFLSYRVFDVRTITEFWEMCGGTRFDDGERPHRALPDLDAAIKETEYYKNHTEKMIKYLVD